MCSLASYRRLELNSSALREEPSPLYGPDVTKSAKLFQGYTSRIYLLSGMAGLTSAYTL